MKKVALITGASSGMGRETAKLLAQNGYITYAAARPGQTHKKFQKQAVINNFPFRLFVTIWCTMQYIDNYQ